MFGLTRSATASLYGDTKVITVTVNAVATSGTTTDAEARFGRVLGIFPASGTAANAVLQSVVLTASTGAIVVTLGAATTNAQVFSVVVALASGDIV